MVWETSRNKLKKHSMYYPKLFWPFTVPINCSSDLKKFAISQPSASNFKSLSWSLEHFFLTVGQNNFGNKIPFAHFVRKFFWIDVKICIWQIWSKLTVKVISCLVHYYLRIPVWKLYMKKIKQVYVCNYLPKLMLNDTGIFLFFCFK